MEPFPNLCKRFRSLRTAARLALAATAVLVVLGIQPVPRADAAVTITSFGARFQNSQVLVTWKTGTELSNLGFVVLRSTAWGGTYTPISGVIPSQAPGTIGSNSYSYTDGNVTVGQTYYYKLQALERGGGTQQFGPVSTDPAGIPSATPTKTNTKIPPSLTPTPTLANTVTRTVAPTASATPSATGTLSPTVTGTPPTPGLTLTVTPLTKVAVAATPLSGKPPSGIIPAATPQGVLPPQADAPQVVTLPSPAADAQEEPSQAVAPEDQGADPVPASPDLRPLVSIFFFGLAGVLGLGSLVFGVLGLVLFARTRSRR